EEGGAEDRHVRPPDVLDDCDLDSEGCIVVSGAIRERESTELASGWIAERIKCAVLYGRGAAVAQCRDARRPRLMGCGEEGELVLMAVGGNGDLETVAGQSHVDLRPNTGGGSHGCPIGPTETDEVIPVVQSIRADVADGHEVTDLVAAPLPDCAMRVVLAHVSNEASGELVRIRSVSFEIPPFNPVDGAIGGKVDRRGLRRVEAHPQGATTTCRTARAHQH